MQPNVSGRHPQFPKNLAAQKVSLKVSPTYLRCELISNLGDYGKKASMEKACKKRQS
jgi:hypothetical protein